MCIRRSIPYRILFFSSIAVIAYILTVKAFLIFSYNIDLDGAEFTFIHYIQQILIENKLYLDPEAFPFSATIYTPLYLHIISAFCNIFGIDPINDIHTIYVSGRILSYLFVLVCLVFIHKFVQKQTKNLLISLICIAVFLILITGHMFAFRPDSMKIAFFIAFLFYYIDYFYYSQNRSSCVLAILFSSLSILAKQDALIYIVLIQTIHLATNRNFLVLKFIVYSSINYMLLFVLMRLYFGPVFFTSIAAFNLQKISNVQHSYNLLVILFNSIRLFPIYALLIFVLFRLKHLTNFNLIKLLSISCIAAAILSTLFLFRPGSYLNYTYELISIVVLLFALIIPNIKINRKWLVLFYLYFSFLLSLNILTRNYIIYPSKEKIHEEKFNGYYQMIKEIEPLLKNNEIIFSPVLELSIFLADKNVIYGQEYHLDRLIFAHLGLHTNSKLMFNSSKNYDAYFTEGKVKYILVNNDENCRMLVKKYYSEFDVFKEYENFILYMYRQ